MKISLWTLLLALLTAQSAAFAVTRRVTPVSLRLRAEEEGSAESTASTTDVPPPTPVVVEEEGPDYPIDLPSPVLLTASIALAIVSTGM